MAAGKSVGNKVMTTRKTRRKSKGKKPCEYIGEFVWLSYIALVLCLIGLRNYLKGRDGDHAVDDANAAVRRPHHSYGLLQRSPGGFQNKAFLFEGSAAIAETLRVKINRRRKSECRWRSWE